MTGIVEPPRTIAPAPARKPRRTLLGIDFDAVTLAEAVERVLQIARGREGGLILTPNVDHLIRTTRDPEFKRICQQGSLVVADGVPVVWASRLLNQALPERVAGSDLMPMSAVAAAQQGLRYYFLGGSPGDAAKAGARIAAAAGNDGLCGVDCPPFGFERDPRYVDAMVERINAARPDILFVALGSPKQEKLMAAIRGRVHIAAMMAVGITFSYVAGSMKRAPRPIQRVGLEWLWRLAWEPRRLWRRYLQNLLLFPWLVGREAMRGLLRALLPGRSTARR
jgi:N-acetylglucosaminyldiphosphoundecaprenol N-acetyl-beta-D-mannosaminyltransferase